MRTPLSLLTAFFVTLAVADYALPLATLGLEGVVYGGWAALGLASALFRLGAPFWLRATYYLTAGAAVASMVHLPAGGPGVVAALALFPAFATVAYMARTPVAGFASAD